MRMFRNWILMMCLFSFLAHAGEVVRVIKPKTLNDGSHGYFVELLQTALNKSAGQYGQASVLETSHLQQGRAFAQLEKNKSIDVFWAATSIEREQKYKAIHIPLLKGLLGYRVAIIHKNNQAKFDQVKTLQDLRKMTACQGAHWPDSDIMEAAGLSVARNPVYESLFKQVNAGRCDYFPRGIHEIVPELKARSHIYPQLMMYSGLIIHYPLPIYYFVSHDKQALHDRIYEGLKIMIADGSFNHILKTNPTTAHLFPVDNWIDNTTIVLRNPYLPDHQVLNNKALWITHHKH